MVRHSSQRRSSLFLRQDWWNYSMGPYHQFCSLIRPIFGDVGSTRDVGCGIGWIRNKHHTLPNPQASRSSLCFAQSDSHFLLYIVFCSSILCTMGWYLTSSLRSSYISRRDLSRSGFRGSSFFHVHADLRCCSSALHHCYVCSLFVIPRSIQSAIDHSSINTIVYCLMYFIYSTQFGT